MINYIKHIWFIDGDFLFTINKDIFNSKDNVEETQDFLSAGKDNKGNNEWFNISNNTTKINKDFTYITYEGPFEKVTIKLNTDLLHK